MNSAASNIVNTNLLPEYKLDSLVENQTKFSLNNCEFSIYETHKAAFGIKLHFEHMGFTSMLRGKKVMKLENRTGYFEYMPGESVLVGAGETMVIDFPEADEAPSQCLSISLNPEFVKNALEILNIHSAKVDETSLWEVTSEEYHLFNNESLASATGNIMRIAMEDHAHKDIMADFALKELLIRLMQTQARGMLEVNSGRKHSRMKYIVDFIRMNLHQKLSIEEMARKAYVSKSNFFKMFKEELGISPNEFIIQERIKMAKHLLGKNNSVKETAYQTGFADTNYFIRVFRQLEGITPKSFQREIMV